MPFTNLLVLIFSKYFIKSKFIWHSVLKELVFLVVSFFIIIFASLHYAYLGYRDQSVLRNISNKRLSRVMASAESVKNWADIVEQG